MLLSKIFSIIGLTLDIIGVIMLFKYGLPANLDKEGNTYIIIEQQDEREKEQWNRFNVLSRIALALVILGFIFQLLAVIVTL